MISGHNREHEELLRSVILGERARSDVGVVERLAACAECRAFLQELDRVEIDAESDLADVDEGASPDSPQVIAILESIAAREPYQRPRRFLRGVLAVAALVIGILVIRAWLPEDPPTSTPIYIGAGGIELRQPLEAVEEYRVFEWSCDSHDVVSYTLRIFDASADRGGTEHLVVPNLQKPTWTPIASQRDALPDRIRWEVEAFGASGVGGEPLHSSSLVSAWRR